MSFPIALCRDDFTAATRSPAWAAFTSGSGSVSQVSGQAVCTLPNATAGSHAAYYVSTAAYDSTGDGLYFDIGTMVATGVAATATLDLFLDGSNILRWQQLSNAITARKVVAGVDTQLFTAAWSASTYKYLRIRESGGTIFFDSSTNGTSWTNRASIVGLPFAVTALGVQFGAFCGNVASPGSLKLDDVNLILPAPSSTWHETTADWSISNRLRPVTLASDGGMLGVCVTADTMDASRVLGGTLHYYAGPLGSSSGGYLALTEYASLALAQASAFPIPVDGRVDLPAMVDARYMRLYHRSIDASGHLLREFVPRRIVQADDIEAESVDTINLRARAVTADKILVYSLQAITASMGSLHMDGVIDITAAGGIYQGSGTFAAPTTGLKLFNSGGVGKLSGYNAGVEQITLDTDGKLKWAAGNGIMDAGGIKIVAPSAEDDARAYTFTDGTNVIGGFYSTYSVAGRDVYLQNLPSTSGGDVGLLARRTSQPDVKLELQNLAFNSSNTILLTATNTAITGGLNLGSATGAGTGQLATSGSAGIGGAALSNVRLFVKGVDTSSSNYAMFIQNNGGGTIFFVRNDNVMGFFGAGGSSRPTVSGSRGGNAALASLLSGMATLGLITDSSSA